MRKIISVLVLCVLALSVNLFALESQDELKAYISGMNKIVIEVEMAMRNLSMNILSPKNATEQMSTAVEKFEALTAPQLFSKDHASMLSAFKTMRDGLKLFSENEKEESRRLMKEGAALLKETAMSIKTKAVKEGLIPAQPKTGDASRPILPSQTPGVIAGTSPTSSPRISSPEVERELITTGTSRSSSEINLQDIPDSPVLKNKNTEALKNTTKPSQ